ncbi:MAG: hypothetical protein NVS2B7_09860 [Herpetosiphon sp.]
MPIVMHNVQHHAFDRYPLLRTIALYGSALVWIAMSLWLRWPSITYHPAPSDAARRDNPKAIQMSAKQEQDLYNGLAFNNLSYSDIASLYFRDRLAAHGRPYLDYRFEYPVGTGLLVYLLNFATTLRAYMLLSTFVLGAAALLTIWLLDRIPGASPWLLALSPSLMLYTNLNWDCWPVLLLVAAMTALQKPRPVLAGLLLAAAIWTKFFPIVVLPFVTLLLLLARDRAAVWRFLASCGSATVLINAPLIRVRPREWWYFFDLSQHRGREVNLWNLFDRFHLSTPTINLLSSLMMAIGLALLALIIWRGRNAWRIVYTARLSDATLPYMGVLTAVSCAAISLFMFVNKVYSPQYSYWIVVLLAMAGAPTALAVAWGAIDVAYFVASFSTLALYQYEPIAAASAPFSRASDWLYYYLLSPAMLVRETLLLAVIAWAAWLLMACLRPVRIVSANRPGDTFLK